MGGHRALQEVVLDIRSEGDLTLGQRKLSDGAAAAPFISARSA
jgi:hypothetical protein